MLEIINFIIILIVGFSYIAACLAIPLFLVAILIVYPLRIIQFSNRSRFFNGAAKALCVLAMNTILILPSVIFYQDMLHFHELIKSLIGSIYVVFFVFSLFVYFEDIKQF
ncbi:MAG: hypothetical protein ABUK01_15560 [Leptospirales bacterium]